MRKDPLVNGEVYHIFNKSIAGFEIFNNQYEYSRIVEVLKFYLIANPPDKFSRARNLNFYQIDEAEKLVEIIAFCIMPTHFHLILKQLIENGISIYMNRIENSYTRYFNTVHKRKGPLWVGRFKNVLVDIDEQLLHLTRYVHLNPVTFGLVNNPSDWEFSSYNEYLGKIDDDKKICEYRDLIDVVPAEYQKFTEDQIAFQKELKRVKDLLLD